MTPGLILRGAEGSNPDTCTDCSAAEVNAAAPGSPGVGLFIYFPFFSPMLERLSGRINPAFWVKHPGQCCYMSAERTHPTAPSVPAGRFGCLGAPAFCSRQLGAGLRPPPRILPADCSSLPLFPGQAPAAWRRRTKRTPTPPCISSPPALAETQKSLHDDLSVPFLVAFPGWEAFPCLWRRGSLPSVSLGCSHVAVLIRIYPPGPLSLVSPWCGRITE